MALDGKIYISLPVTVQGYSCSSIDIAESERGNQIALSPTSVKGGRNILKTYFVLVIKSNILVFITIYSVR